MLFHLENHKGICNISSVQIILYFSGLFGFQVKWYCEVLILLQDSITDHFKSLLCIRHVTPSYGISKGEHMQNNFLNTCTCHDFFNNLLRAIPLLVSPLNKDFVNQNLNKALGCPPTILLGIQNLYFSEGSFHQKVSKASRAMSSSKVSRVPNGMVISFF